MYLGDDDTHDNVCDPSTINLADYDQWVDETGYWIGEYTFLKEDGTPYKSSSWPYRYDSYKGFITGSVKGWGNFSVLIEKSLLRLHCVASYVAHSRLRFSHLSGTLIVNEMSLYILHNCEQYVKHTLSKSFLWLAAARAASMATPNSSPLTRMPPAATAVILTDSTLDYTRLRQY